MSEEIDLNASAKPALPVQDQMAKLKVERSGKLAELREKLSDAELVAAIAASDENELFPWENCQLPSKGLYYGWTTGVIEVRPWGIAVDKILANQRLAQSGQTIDYVLKHCCRFPDDFDQATMLVGDQIFLLYYLRGITHGNNYEFTLQCPNKNCEASNLHKVDLNQLSDTIIWADESLGEEPFHINLPYLTEQTGRDFWVEVRFLRVADSQSIAKAQKAKNRVLGSAKVRQRQRPDQRQQIDPLADDTLSQNIEQLIVSVLGTRDKFTIQKIVNRMHSRDLATIREWLAAKTPGIQPTIDITCPTCSETYPVMLPITEAFFRPQDVGTV